MVKKALASPIWKSETMGMWRVDGIDKWFHTKHEAKIALEQLEKVVHYETACYITATIPYDVRIAIENMARSQNTSLSAVVRQILTDFVDRKE